MDWYHEITTEGLFLSSVFGILIVFIVMLIFLIVVFIKYKFD
jgi:tetrahydromethanopterin S-methyltransferase subunit B